MPLSIGFAIPSMARREQAWRWARTYLARVYAAGDRSVLVPANWETLDLNEGTDP